MKHYSFKLDSMGTHAQESKAMCGTMTRKYASVPTCPECRQAFTMRLRQSLAFLGTRINPKTGLSPVDEAIARYFEDSSESVEPP
jgi:hypothetical protein